MKNFLRVTVLAICAIFMVANVSAQDNYDATTMGEKVYLETASWGQNSPFNKQIFTSYGGSTNAKAGCVPTAYAIVMRYHGFPTEGTAKTLYNCQAPTYVEITDRVYDFSKMPLTYNSDWTQEQIDEVSKFFSHILHACFPSSIGTGATTVNEGSDSKVLNDYFNYQLINASYQANFTMEQWIEKIKESIDNGCPIPYASDNSGTGDTRHMFVLDGYTANNYFHFNFGWNGSGNGWFKLDAITPSQGDNYSWIDGAEHYALFNLAPKTEKFTVTATATPSNMGTVSINGGTAGTTASAEINENFTATLTAHPADGYALANWTKNGVIVGTKNTLQVKVGASDNDYVANFDDEANVLVEKDCTFNISSVEISGANGSYCSTWTTSDGIVLNCSKGSEPAYALSTTVNTFFAKAPVGNSETLVSDITYTLTAPAGYIIKSYSFKGKSPSSSYTIDVTIGGNTTNVNNAAAGVVFSASDINSQSTSFVLGSTYAGRAGLAILEDGVTVTIQSEGGASTPTPDPEPEPEPDPTPTTYAVTTTANPAAGGTAKFAVGTGSQKTQGDVENGTQITLYATANTGYNFVNWTLGGNVVSTEATCNVSVAQASNYVANFESNTPTEPTTSLAGKFFRLKVKNTTNYMNIANTSNNTGSTSGVTVVAKNESSDTQIFLFEQSGDGYKLKANSGNYIKCHAWNANANTTSANDATVLTFETTGNELEYLIKWDNTNMNNGVERDDYFKAENGYVYCDAASNAASTWVLEEVIPSNEKTLNLTFADVTYTNYAGNTINSGWGYKAVVNTTPTVTIKVDGITNNNLGWTTKVNGNKTPYLAKATNFTISIPEPYKIAGYSMTIRGEGDSFSGDVTYTATNNNTGTIAISGTTEKTISATGLETNTINIGVGGTAGNGIFITALEITYIEEEFVPAMFQAEVENWRNDNPNTHLGTITIGGTAMKLTPAHQTASELTMPLAEGTTLAFTRKYRGFEFNGFYIGATSLGTNPTLTADNVAAINETTPLVAKFTATNDVTLFYDDDEFSYRIPAIAKTGTNRLVAVSDYRHSHDDIGRDNHGTGTNRVDLVMRTSDDNGATWTAKQTIAEGTSTFGYGDAAIVANGQDILVMAVAGNVFYPNANATNKNKTYRIYSNNNGQSWTKEEVTSNIFGLFDEAYATFFGSGKLAVDPDFNGTGKARVYGAILLKNSARSTNNYVLFSDDWGATWNILGGSKTHIAEADEPKVEILPNGQVLLSSRHASGGSRVFNVFTYGNDKAAGEGTWGTAVSGCSNEGKNGTNGEIICLDAKQTNGKPTKILLQSQPQGGSSTWDRKDVTIWYKEIGNETQTPSSIAGGWTKGLQVSTVQSAYSAMALQENGEIAFFFEEAPCHNDDNTYGYSMVYVPLTIEEITNNNFLNPNADVEYVPVEFNIELTDTEGNIYRETLDYVPNDAAAVATYLTTTYPFITLGENGAIADNTYTNTVTLPFKVSNANTTVWHNIYWPANTRENDYPVYLSASSKDDTYVPKVTDSYAYGNHPTYNTLDGNEKISWAIYNVNNGFEFIFKNKVTQKYIQVTNVADDGAQNVVYVENIEEATAFTIFNKPAGNDYYTPAQYALAAKVGETTGYLCSTSATGYNYATHYFNNSNNGYGHQGAWIEFVEAPDYQAIIDALTENVAKFGAGDGNYTDNNDINAIKAIIENIANTPLNTLNTHTETVQNVKESYREVVLTVNDEETETVPGSVSITVNGSAAETVNNKFVPANATVSILATANPGYRFVNWTRPAAQASAAARTAEARNSNVVSDQNPYTVTVSEALSLEANFEQIVVDVVLTEIIGTNAGQTNEYRIRLDGFTNGITKETVAAKLVELYPYIALGEKSEDEVIDNGKLQINGNSYTYTNNVILPFKVSNAQNEIWHNIYWPSNTKNNDYPVYLSASSADDTYVPKVTGSYAYGDHPTYNTMGGNPKIAWAIYNVNNSFEFIFKNELTGKYIQVTSVANGDAQNVVYVENAIDATVFTIEKKPAGNDYYTDAQYSLTANVGEEKGYLCSTSATGYNYATHYNSNGHQGAWFEFVESPYYEVMLNDTYAMYYYYAGVGEGKCIITDALVPIVENLGDFEKWGGLTYNTINAYAAILEEAWRWPAIKLNIKPTEGGTTSINGEENVTKKKAPIGYQLPLVATPAVGYHFVNWSDSTSTVLSENAEYTTSTSGSKNWVTNINVNFAINIYNINVTAGEGGSATASATNVEHGSEVTLTATPSTGYSFAGWYDGENLISAEASYTFTVTSHINYTARFNEVPTGTVAIHITVASTDGTTVTNAVDGNVKAIINNIGQAWATDADFVVGADVELVASSDYDQKAYLFDGWYKNDVLVSKELAITVQATEAATYQARFFRGCVVIGEPKSNRIGYVTKITLPDGTSLGYDASNRAVVKEGTEVMINTWLSYGYETIWKDENDNIVGNEQNLVITIEKDVTYTATFEPASYNLTVRANDDSYGTVTAESDTSSGTTIKVGHNMEATITATANTGYYFVNWTKGTDVVSSENPYTIPGIANVENMEDAEYVANFLPVENATAGVYYRIGYDGFAAAASAGAARAAGDVVTIDLTTGAFGGQTGDKTTYSQWTSDNGVNIIARDANGTEIASMKYNNGFQLHLIDGVTTPVEYTITVPEGYTLTEMSYKNGYRTYDMTVSYNSENVSLNGGTSVQTITFIEGETSFKLSGIIGRYIYVTALTMIETGNSEGDEGEGSGETPETPANRYYIQSEASGVTNKANALLMTKETGAASIFYYADNKLLSYDKGTYIKEDGGTRGLQAVGTSGTVTITTSGETTTIAAPSYLHAVDGTTRYVDHCSGNPDNHATNHNFVLEEVESLPVTIGSALHATFYAPVAVEIPEGVRAYVLKEKNITADSWVTMTMLQNGIIPANTGVILRSDEAKIYDFIITENTDAARAEAVGNILEGTVAKSYVNKDAYILTKKSNGVGMYPLSNNSYITGGATATFTNNSHKAYLPVEGNFAQLLQQGTGFRFVFDDGTTEIEEIEREVEDTIYDLQGRKLNEITEPGFYIVNGKKIFVK